MGAAASRHRLRRRRRLLRHLGGGRRGRGDAPPLSLRGRRGAALLQQARGPAGLSLAGALGGELVRPEAAMYAQKVSVGKAPMTDIDIDLL